jgi:hypothetical protein
MSVELHVLLRKDRLPDAKRWQASIDELGFDVQLPSFLVLASHSGFLPARFKGESSGFEIDLSPASVIICNYPEQAAHFTDTDCSANFRWGSDATETACALAAAAALTNLSAGVWFYPADQLVLDSTGAIEEARNGVAAADQS